MACWNTWKIYYFLYKLSTWRDWNVLAIRFCTYLLSNKLNINFATHPVRCFLPEVLHSLWFQVPASGEQIEADIEVAGAIEAIGIAAMAANMSASSATSQGTLRRSSSTLSRNSLLSSRRNSGVSPANTPGSSTKHQRRRRNSSVFEQGSLGSSFDEPASSSTSLCGNRSFKLMAKMRSVSRDRPRITITRAPTLDQSGLIFFLSMSMLCYLKMVLKIIE